MTLSFWISDVCLVGVQSAIVALPRDRPPPALARLAARVRGPGWALAPLLSLVAVVGTIRAADSSADWFAWLALIAVPPLAAVALDAAMRGGRPPLALAAAPLFALAWLDRGHLPGEAAAVALSALSCVTLGVLLVAVAPRGWVKVGIVLMAAVDAVLVGVQLLQPANDLLNAAAPPGRLPQLQRAVLGDALIGYGDLFIAAVLGALVAVEADGASQRRVALLVLALALCFDLLFLVVDVLPATVPVAAAMVVWEARRRRRVAPEMR